MRKKTLLAEENKVRVILSEKKKSMKRSVVPFFLLFHIFIRTVWLRKYMFFKQ